MHSQIKSLLQHNDFTLLKESNYHSIKPLTEFQIQKIEDNFVERYPKIVFCLTKWDWAIWNPRVASHSVARIKATKEALDQLE